VDIGWSETVDACIGVDDPSIFSVVCVIGENVSISKVQEQLTGICWCTCFSFPKKVFFNSCHSLHARFGLDSLLQYDFLNRTIQVSIFLRFVRTKFDISQLYRGGQFLLVEETTDLSKVTNKFYHIMLHTSPWSRFELITSVVIDTDWFIYF
jgi:hypothetical protein